MPRITSFAIAAVVLASFDTARAEVAGVRIGGFSFTRATDSNLVDGSLTDELRASTFGHFPGSTIAGTDFLTPSFLTNIDVLVLANSKTLNSSITSLSADEQTALLNFVQGGGSALLLADGYFLPQAQSFVTPFGLQMGGATGGIAFALVTYPLAHPVTHGPFGEVPTYGTYFSGWFTDLGPLAMPLATLPVMSSDMPVLAVIEAGALSPTSGRMVITADASFGDAPYGFIENETLYLNSISWLASVPEPSTGVLAGLSLTGLVSAFLVRRSITQSPRFTPRTL